MSHKHTLTWTNDITPNMLPDIKPPPGAVSSEALNHLLKVFSTFTSQQSREGLEAQHYMTCSWIICVLIRFLLSSHRESKAIFFLVSVHTIHMNIHTQIHTLMTGSSVQSANLLIKNTHTHTHTYPTTHSPGPDVICRHRQKRILTLP